MKPRWLDWLTSRVTNSLAGLRTALGVKEKEVAKVDMHVGFGKHFDRIAEIEAAAAVGRAFDNGREAVADKLVTQRRIKRSRCGIALDLPGGPADRSSTCRIGVRRRPEDVQWQRIAVQCRASRRLDGACRHRKVGCGKGDFLAGARMNTGSSPPDFNGAPRDSPGSFIPVADATRLAALKSR